MEFLISNVSVDDSEMLSARLRGVRLSESPQVTISDYQDFQLYLVGPLLSDGAGEFCFDGSVFLTNKLITNFRNCDGTSLRELKDAASSRPGETAGCFCLLSIERSTREFLIQFDPLAAYPCYIWRSGDAFAVSNNIHFINAVVAASGAKLTRTILPYLADFALGSAYDVGSPYEEVDIIGPGEIVRGGQGVRVVPRGVHLQDVADGASYEETLSLAAQRLRDRVGIVAETFDDPNVFFDLTGGMDSRIVLAAIVSRQSRPAWDYRTLFDYPHPDGHCAALFGETFGLGRVQGIPWNSGRVMTGVERFRFEAFASMGVGAKMGWSISPPYVDIAHIHGGYGEIAGSSPDAKRFLGEGGKRTYQALCENYMNRMSALGVLRYFTPRGVEWLRGLLAGRLGTFEAVGVPAASAPVHYYNCGRLRSHFGVISRLRGQERNYIDLLYDMYLQSCALKTNPFARAKGKVNFDLIRLVGGDAVAGLPMANDQWDASVFATDEQRVALQKPRVTATTPQSFHSLPEIRAIPPIGPGPDTSFRPQPDPKMKQYAIDKIAVPLRIAYRRQAFLATYLPDSRAAEGLADILDWAEIDAMLAAPVETLNRYPFDVVMQALCDCVIWHQHMELSVFA